MALFSALGLGVAIFVLQVLAPDIWGAVEQLTLSVLQIAGEFVHQLPAAAAAISLPTAY